MGESENLSSRTGNKSGNIYCKLGKGDSLFVAKAKLFPKVAESSSHVQKQCMVALIAFAVVDF